MKILFIGQAPSRDSDPLRPFSGRCGKFLAELLDTTQEDMLEQHDFLNVLDEWPGKGVGGDRFPILVAMAAARRKVPQLRGRTVVLLGANVARAFGAKNFQYLQFYRLLNPENYADVLSQKMCVVPHPSGINRWYNRRENRDIVSKFLRELATQQ